MTDSPPSAAPSPAAEPPPERVRVNADPAARPGRSPAVAPVVYAAGLVVLAVALFFLWRYPTTSRRGNEEGDRVAALTTQLAAMGERIARLEGRTGPDLAPLDARLARLEARTPPDLGPLDARLARLEARTPPDLGPLDARVARMETRTIPDLGPLDARLTQLENRPPPPPPDLGGILARIDAVGRDAAAAADKRGAEVAALGQLVARQGSELGSRLSDVDSHVSKVEQDQQGLAGLAGRARRTARVQAASAALDAGAPLGPIADAPPALARFASAPPPTLSSLRLSFPAAADAAHRASQPAITADQNFLQRAWTTAQQAVTVRQGDRVMLGDPIGGILAHARELLDAGDLPGCLQVLNGLAGPAAAALADWTGQARALLDARAALATLAAQG